jgi:hypothetical protein
MLPILLGSGLKQALLRFSSSRDRSQYEAKSRRNLRWALLALLLLAVGCDRQSLLKKVNEFDRQVNESTVVITDYYQTLNKQEVDLYLLVLELEPNCRMGNYINYNCLQKNWDESAARNNFTRRSAADPNIKDPCEESSLIQDRDGWLCSPLERPPFSEKGIKARLNLLKSLTEYSKELAKLAGDNSPSKFQENVTTLKSRLISLGETLKLDSTATQYIDPISKIIGILGKLALQEYQWGEARKFIIEAEPDINKILDFLAQDLDKYRGRLLEVNTEARYTLLMNYYNTVRKEQKREERSVLLNEIRESKAAYDLAVREKPSKVPIQLKDIYGKLVKLAQSDGAVQDLAQLNAAIDLFKDDIEQLKTAVIQLLEKKENK